MGFILLVRRDANKGLVAANLHSIYIYIVFLYNKNLNVMDTELTLKLEHTIIEKAKDYAKSHRISLSTLIENYLKSLTKEVDNKENIKLSPLVKSLKGSFKMPINFDYKEEVLRRVEEKYL